MAKKVQTTTIDSVEALQARLKEMRAAQAEFATFSQEQVDKIFYEAAMAANKQRIPLAKMAVEETGMGVMEDKVIKNHYAAEYIYNKYKDMKTCGVIEDDPAMGFKKVAEPMGIVAAVRYPGLTSDAAYQEASSTLRCGFGPWVDVRLADAEKDAWLRVDVTNGDAPAWVMRLEALLAER